MSISCTLKKRQFIKENFCYVNLIEHSLFFLNSMTQAQKVNLGADKIKNQQVIVIPPYVKKLLL